MFRKITIAAFFLILLCTASVCYLSIQIRPSDAPSYKKLIQESAELRSKKALERAPAHQVRKGVQKDIWTLSGNDRSHLQLNSEGSDLIIQQKKEKFEAIEHLQNLECSVDQGDHSPHLKADRATYSISDFQFIELTDQVEISERSGPCARGGSALYRKGKAILYPKVPNLRCSLSFKEDLIEAKRIEFDLEKEELFCDQPIGTLFQNPIYFSASSMTWRRPKNEIALEGTVQIEHLNEMKAEGSSALVTYQGEFQCTHFSLKGNVSLQSNRIDGKESFALADALSYNPTEKLFILSAEAPKKVLFWQDDLRLSANEVRIRPDPNTKLDSIEGIGDVHFAFDLEEENAIHEFFRNLL